MIQMDRSCYQDLTVFGVCVVVDNDVTSLFGVVDSEVDIHDDIELENYLLQKLMVMFLQSPQSSNDRWDEPRSKPCITISRRL